MTEIYERSLLLGRHNKAIHLAPRQINIQGSKDLESLQSNGGKEAHRTRPAAGRWTLADTGLQHHGGEGIEKKR